MSDVPILTTSPVRMPSDKPKPAGASTMIVEPCSNHPLSRLVQYSEYTDDAVFSADDAPAGIAVRRRAGFERLAQGFAERYRVGRALTAETQQVLSDLQFTSNYRVPFQFRRFVRERLNVSAFLASSSGVEVEDLDGNRSTISADRTA